jgi:hypothetical protein
MGSPVLARARHWIPLQVGRRGGLDWFTPVGAARRPARSARDNPVYPWINLRQLGVNRSRFPMNKPDCVPDDIVEIPQVHCLARLIEPERKRDRQAGTACRNLLVRTLHVLEMMREDIDQFEFKRLLTPVLADNRDALPTFLGCAINGMEDRDASKIRMANRAAVAVEVVEGGIDDDFEIPSERFHATGLFLITDFIGIALPAPPALVLM